MTPCFSGFLGLSSVPISTCQLLLRMIGKARNVTPQFAAMTNIVERTSNLTEKKEIRKGEENSLS